MEEKNWTVLYEVCGLLQQNKTQQKWLEFNKNTLKRKRRHSLIYYDLKEKESLEQNVISYFVLLAASQTICRQ
jgi:hypothetical protein